MLALFRMKNNKLAKIRLQTRGAAIISILYIVAFAFPQKSIGMDYFSAPANDNCSNATALAMGATAISGTLSGATATTGATFTNKTTTPDIWYSFTATCTQLTVSFTYTTSKAGISFEVYPASSCPSSGSPIFYGNAPGTLSYATVAYGLTIGTNYYIRVIDNLTPSSTPLTIAISSNPAASASVTSKSASSITATTATLNGNAIAFTCQSSSKGFVYSPISTNNNPINGGMGVSTVSVPNLTTDTFSLALTGLTSGVGYSYKSYIFDGTTYTYSSVQTFTTISIDANLSALLINTATISPVFASATTAYSSSVTNSTSSVTVTATKSNAFAAIQLQLNGGVYFALTSGVASSSLVLNVGSNTINVKATAQDGSTIKIYTITLCRSVVPSVSILASANPICSGTSVTFTATPTNGGTPTYQWQKGGVNISGATASTFTSSSLANNNGITVIMTSTATCASPITATSNTVTMTVNALPAATTSTVIHDICQVGAGSITLAISGGAPNYTVAACGTTVPPSTTVGQYVSVTGSPALGVTSTKTFSGLNGNIAYNFTITDANGCVAQ